MSKEIDYSDIIDLPHHQSTRHPRMGDAERAAQFAPFAALSGFDKISEPFDDNPAIFVEK